MFSVLSAVAQRNAQIVTATTPCHGLGQVQRLRMRFHEPESAPRPGNLRPVPRVL